MWCTLRDGKDAHRLIPYPAFLVRAADGSWTVRNMFLNFQCGTPEFGREFQIPGSEHAWVLTEDESGHTVPIERFADRSLNISIDYSHVGAPLGLSESAARSCIERAVAQYRTLLVNESVSLTFQFRWANLAAPNLAKSYVTFAQDYWPYWRSTLAEMMDTGDYDPDEVDVVYNLTGISVPYSWSGGNTNTSNILLSAPLFAARSGFPVDPLLIEISNAPGLKWAADSRGVGIGPSERDLEAVLVHELGHHFGFGSMVESNDSFFNNYLTSWDVYRFPESFGQINSVQMQSGRREQTLGAPANAAVALNSQNRFYSLSTGQFPNGTGNQASHWISSPFGGPSYLGIMVPGLAAGVGYGYGTFLQFADIQAFDLMGWNIRQQGGIVPPPLPPIPASPSSGAVITPGGVSLSWTPGTNSTSSNAAVYELGPVNAATLQDRTTDRNRLVYYQRGLSGSSITTPAGTTRSGYRYRWFSTAENWRGAIGSNTLFSTTGTPCPSDLNSDALVDDTDFQQFVTAYDLLDCSDPFMPSGCPADFNGDGSVDDSDFSQFVAAYDQLVCP